MDASRKSLEDNSVIALVEASEQPDLVTGKHPDELFHKHLTRSLKSLPNVPRRRIRQFYIQPCLRSVSLNSRCTRIKIRSISIGKEDPQPIDALDQLPNMGSFKAYLTGTDPQVSKCKCMFLGGGGFKITSTAVPCDSRLCVNRPRNKFEWNPEGSDPGVQRGKKTGEDNFMSQSALSNVWFPGDKSRSRVWVTKSMFFKAKVKEEMKEKPKSKIIRIRTLAHTKDKYKSTTQEKITDLHDLFVKTNGRPPKSRPL